MSMTYKKCECGNQYVVITKYPKCNKLCPTCSRFASRTEKDYNNDYRGSYDTQT